MDNINESKFTKEDLKNSKFPRPTRNNLSKEEASKCKHHWAYGGGSMWCVHCGWFQQPDGRITKTVSGKSGEFLESAFIDVSDYFGQTQYMKESFIGTTLGIIGATIVLFPIVMCGIAVTLTKIMDNKDEKAVEKTISNILGNPKRVELKKYLTAANSKFDSYLKDHKSAIIDGLYKPDATKSKIDKSHATFGSIAGKKRMDREDYFSEKNLAFVNTNVIRAVIKSSDREKYISKLNKLSDDIKISLSVVDWSCDDNWRYFINAGLINEGPEEIGSDAELEDSWKEFSKKVDDLDYCIIDIVMLMPAKKFLIENFGEGSKVKTESVITEGIFGSYAGKKNKTDNGTNSDTINKKINDLPKEYQTIIKDTNEQLVNDMKSIAKGAKYKLLSDAKMLDELIMAHSKSTLIGHTQIKKDGESYSGFMMVTDYLNMSNFSDYVIPDGLTDDELFQQADILIRDLIKAVFDKNKDQFNDDNPGMKLVMSAHDGYDYYFEIHLTAGLAKKLWDQFKNPAVIKEAAEPEYNTDMSELQAKKTMRTLSQSLMNDLSNDKKMTQYTANIYANIITKNLLPKWANGFSRLKITLDSYQSLDTFQFITPAMSQDFIGRFVNGRESMHGFLHRSPEIRIKVSPKVFHTMKNPDDAYNFFKAAIKYYDTQVEKYAVKVVAEAMKLGHNMKHLIANSKLSGIVSYPLTMLFVFDGVDISNKDIFKINTGDIQTINKFIRNISSRYAAPEKEKKQIVDDVKKMVEALRESCGINDTTKELHYLHEAVDNLLFGGYDKLIIESSRLFIESRIDHKWNPPASVKYMKESWGVKKLKKIPKDLIPYIQIETEAIKDANDKMILSSYTLGKIEIVEWYIELLTVGSKKYIVPHTKPYLELVRTQLLQCFKKIMDTPIKKSDKTIDIKYPPGYEG